MKCNFCGKELDVFQRSKYCNRQCYDHHYYNLNKEKRSKYFKEKYKRTYIPRPKTPKIVLSEEEIRERRRQYYETHKEYYKIKAHEHYERNKNNPEYKHRKNEATKRYQKRRRIK